VKEETFMATGREFKGNSNNANESKQSVLQHRLVALVRSVRRPHRANIEVVARFLWRNDDVKTTHAGGGPTNTYLLG